MTGGESMFIVLMDDADPAEEAMAIRKKGLSKVAQARQKFRTVRYVWSFGAWDSEP